MLIPLSAISPTMAQIFVVPMSKPTMSSAFFVILQLNPYLKKLTSNYQIDYVFANLTSFPRNTEFQNSENVITSEPDAKITENKNSILYYWSNPSQDQLKFSVESKINSRTNFKEITSKIKFPIEDNTFESYTIATETVTSNDTEIKKLASNLAEGEDDLYNVVWKIALWTHDNINYSLNTLTAEVSQNSRWVLDNREGVCDELTSLFIAMLRSLNIPARFVTGQSYTNVLNGFGLNICSLFIKNVSIIVSKDEGIFR